MPSSCLWRTHAHCPSDTSLYLAWCHFSIPKRVSSPSISAMLQLCSLNNTGVSLFPACLESFYTTSSCPDMESFRIVANCSLAQWQPLLLRYVACTIFHRGTLNAHIAQSGTEVVTHRGWAMTRTTAAPFLQKPHKLCKRVTAHDYFIRIDSAKINFERQLPSRPASNLYPAFYQTKILPIAVYAVKPDSRSC